MPEITITTPLCAKTWTDVLSDADCATPFHEYEYLDLISRVNNLIFTPLGLACGSVLVGLLPIMQARKGPFRIAGCPLAYSGISLPYLGPVISRELYSEALHCFEQWLTNSGIDYAEMRVPPDRELSALGSWEKGSASTVLMKIPKDLEVLWKNVTSRGKGSIRKAQSLQVEIREIDDDNFFSEYIRMAEHVYRKSSRLPPLKQDYFHALWNLWNASGRMKVLAAFHDGKAQAAAIFLLDHRRKTAYYLDGVSYPDANKICANNLLQWIFLQSLARSGYERYDMLGATFEGIRKFKLSFGGTLVDCDYRFQTRTATARIARDVYRRMMALSRRAKFIIRGTSEPTH